MNKKKNTYRIFILSNINIGIRKKNLFSSVMQEGFV